MFCYVYFLIDKLTGFDARHAADTVAEALLPRAPAVFVRYAFP